jgi:hypothetical protein
MHSHVDDALNARIGQGGSAGNRFHGRNIARTATTSRQRHDNRPVALSVAIEARVSISTTLGQAVQALLKSLAKASTQSQMSAGPQYDFVFALRLKRQTADPREIHDDRTMYADELIPTQVLFQLQEATANDVSLGSDMQACVIACGFNPVDFPDLQQ